MDGKEVRYVLLTPTQLYKSYQGKTQVEEMWIAMLSTMYHTNGYMLQAMSM